MIKRVYFCLALCLLCILSFGSTVLAADNTSIIPGVGKLTFPAEIELLPYNGDYGIGHDLLVDDNGTWRAAHLSFIGPTTGENINNLNDRTNPINQIVVTAMYLKSLEPKSRLLQSTPFNSIALKDERTRLKSFKTLHYIFVVQTDYYLINRPDGIRILILECENSDMEYWTPIITKVIANIQK